MTKAFFIPLAVALASCTVDKRVEVANLSSEPLQVGKSHLKGKRIEEQIVKPGESIDYTIGRSHTRGISLPLVRVSTRHSDALDTISLGSKRYAIPPDYWPHVNYWASMSFPAQIRHSGGARIEFRGENDVIFVSGEKRVVMRGW